MCPPICFEHEFDKWILHLAIDELCGYSAYNWLLNPAMCVKTPQLLARLLRGARDHKSLSFVFSANTLTHNQDNEEPDSGVCARKMSFKCVVVCILIQRVHIDPFIFTLRMRVCVVH